MHKIYLQRVNVAHDSDWAWTVKLADTALIKIIAGGMHHNSDGMAPPSYDPSSYQFKPDNADDGHYQVYINDTLNHDFFIYRHWPLGKDMRASYIWETTYGWYLQPYPDGDLWLLYSKEGELYDRHWAGKNAESSPVTESFMTLDDGIKTEEINLYAAGQLVGRRNMNVTANTFRWEDVDSTYGYLVRDAQHHAYDPAYIDSFKKNKHLNGQYTFILKELVDKGDVGYYQYSGLMVRLTFKDNHFVSWTSLRKHKHKLIEITTYTPSTKPIPSRDKAQEYLETVLLKGK